MQTLTRPPPTTTRGEELADSSLLARGCEVVLDAAVVVLATWTVVYHVSLLLRVPAAVAVGIEIVVLAGLPFVSRRRSRSLPVGADETDVDGARHAHNLIAGASSVEKTLLAVAAAAGAVAAGVVASGGAWPVIAAQWMTSAVCGAAAAVLRLRRSTAPAPTAAAAADDNHAPTRAAVTRSAGIALLWATSLAALAMFARRPNPDDLYYVNLSQWIVDHGTFPVRDTIFSDLVFPMSSWPPVASYDGLAGAVALLTGVQAASVVYLVVPPLVTFLSVLALWRLLRDWRVPAVGVALSLALVFLLYDGGPGYAAPGTLFLTRLWQGKVILLCLLVPTLLVYALRYVEQPSRVRAGWLFAGGVAAVGLSTTAMFIVPMIAMAGVAPLAMRRPRQALTGFAAMAAYPLAAGVVTLAVGGRSADFFETRRLFRFDPSWFGPEIFRAGPIALIAVAAVLAGALLLPLLAARVTVGVLTVIVGVTFIPGVTQVAFDLVGLGPTLWRVSWITPIAALVGVLGVRIGSFGNRRWLMTATATAVAVTLALTGIPIWSAANGVELDTTPRWKRGPITSQTAQVTIDLAEPGDLILAHQQLAVTITVLTTRVKTVAPRDYFMDYLRDEPSFYYDERQTLLRFVNEPYDYESRPEAARALELLDVDHVCVKKRSYGQMGLLRAEGYRRTFSNPLDVCFTRKPSAQDVQKLS